MLSLQQYDGVLIYRNMKFGMAHFDGVLLDRNVKFGMAHLHTNRKIQKKNYEQQTYSKRTETF